MKYASTLPLTALFAVGLIAALVNFGIVPPGLTILENLQDSFGDYFYLLVLLIILMESIVYVGFYFPGQFFAVILVISSKPDFLDIVYLTLAMVVAATLGSIINFIIGRFYREPADDQKDTKLRHLLLAMIHINSLAFFMVSQGANNRSFKVVWLAGLFNLPYYLLLIAATAILSEEIMQIAENTWLLAGIITVWLLFSMGFDYRQHKQKKDPSQMSGAS